jgi:hypothetical protein
MNDPPRDKRESSSQPKEFPRTPNWVITDWGEPESKAPVTPKFSIRDVWAFAKLGLVICLLSVRWFFLSMLLILEEATGWVQGRLLSWLASPGVCYVVVGTTRSW